MIQNPWLRLSVCALVLAIADTGHAQREQLSFVGEAFNDSGNLIYTEHHQLTGTCTDSRWRPEDQSVQYYWPGEATPFATKKLRYPEALTRPQVEFSLAELDASMTITTDDAGGALDIQWWSESRQIKQFLVPTKPDLVVDAGFDQLVRERWDELHNGASVDFRFLAPTRGTDFGFQLAPESPSELDFPLVITVRPSGLITRFLVKPITLGYNDTGLLSYYSGLTNIPRNRDGDNYSAEILYTTTQRPPCPLIP